MRATVPVLFKESVGVLEQSAITPHMPDIKDSQLEYMYVALAKKVIATTRNSELVSFSYNAARGYTITGDSLQPSELKHLGHALALCSGVSVLVQEKGKTASVYQPESLPVLLPVGFSNRHAQRAVACAFADALFDGVRGSQPRHSLDHLRNEIDKKRAQPLRKNKGNIIWIGGVGPR